jgi:multimeric flavodoxin WrbA
MNIIAICGSPRKGNTEFTLKRFLTKAEEYGHKVELVLLREKRISYCNGCNICMREGNPCPIVDDAKMIMERMAANDMIVFGSPNYYNNVTGTMKVFFDRLNPFYSDKKLSGKKAIAIFVGDEVKSIDKAIFSVQSIANSFGLDLVGDLYLCASGPQDVERNAESVQKIDEFAKNILS